MSDITRSVGHHKPTARREVAVDTTVLDSVTAAHSALSESLRVLMRRDPMSAPISDSPAGRAADSVQAAISATAAAISALVSGER